MDALPHKYRDLEPFVPIWAHATENARSQQRWASSPADFQAFYGAMLPRIEEALTDLDRYPPDAIPDEAKPLYRLVLAFAEVAPHVEMYGGSAEVPHSFPASRVRAKHGAVAD